MTESTVSEDRPKQEGSRPKARPKVVVGIVLASALVIGLSTWGIAEFSKRRTVPDLNGLTLQEALDQSREAGLEFQPAQAEEVAALRDANTEVTEQSPAAGSTLKAGETISAKLQGREAAVPDITGLSVDEAGLVLQVPQFGIEHEFGENLIPATWRIVEQSVEPGSDLRSGRMIEAKFDVPEIVMQDLIGTNLSDAQGKLEGQGLLASVIGQGSHVAHASFAAGTVLDPFDTVELTAGYLVPDVVGMTATEAMSALSEFTDVTREGHGARPISTQSVPAGSFVSSDTEIVITSPPAETVYRIIGNGSTASITWAAPGTFAIQQAIDTALPWEMSFPTDSGTAVFNAQSMSGDSITCQLERNGKVVKELTSTGMYAVVQC